MHIYTSYGEINLVVKRLFAQKSIKNIASIYVANEIVSLEAISKTIIITKSR